MLDPIGSGSTNDALGAAIAFAFMGLCSLVFAITRATAARRTFTTSRHKVEAEPALLTAVARRQRARALMFAAGCVLAGLGVAALPIAIETRIALSVTPGLMALVGLVSAWRLHALLGATTDRVSSHGLFLYASRDGRLVGWVSAPPVLIARATALPIARLHVVVEAR